MDSENKIELAREAMLLFVKSLPVGCHFNIIRFGSRFESLFDDMTAIYDEQHARTAEVYAEHLKADLGGTDLVSLLLFNHHTWRKIYEFYFSCHLFFSCMPINQRLVVLVKYFF